jgi:hypothetical protein
MFVTCTPVALVIANASFFFLLSITRQAAKLTYANLPLIIGLAGKNNVLSKLTGFAYESLNVLHRWSARFVIISSTIHIAGRIHVRIDRSNC